MGDTDYSTRWRRIKEEFTRNFLALGGNEATRGLSRKKRKERGVWQRRFWEHTIEDDDDFDAHFDYLHYNPVKHGYVQSPSDWEYSSFHRWVKASHYEANWGRGEITFDDLNETAMD